MLDISALLKGTTLFKTVFPNENTVEWRLLTLKEYRVFQGLRQLGTLSEEYIYYSVFKHCYQGNAALLNRRMPAGILISVGRLIMYLSGDCEVETIKNDILVARALYNGSSINEYMKRIVFMAFSTYTPEDADSWTRKELLEKFVLAETILVEKGIIEAVLDPEKLFVSGERAKEETVGAPIDFEAEAVAHLKELGPWAQSDIIEEEVKNSKKVLNKEQASKLDKRRRG